LDSFACNSKNTPACGNKLLYESRRHPTLELDIREGRDIKLSLPPPQLFYSIQLFYNREEVAISKIKTNSLLLILDEGEENLI
jgi:hypothetical protein